MKFYIIFVGFLIYTCEINAQSYKHLDSFIENNCSIYEDIIDRNLSGFVDVSKNYSLSKNILISKNQLQKKYSDNWVNSLERFNNKINILQVNTKIETIYFYAFDSFLLSSIFAKYVSLVLEINNNEKEKHIFSDYSSYNKSITSLAEYTNTVSPAIVTFKRNDNNQFIIKSVVNIYTCKDISRLYVDSEQ